MYLKSTTRGLVLFLRDDDRRKIGGKSHRKSCQGEIIIIIVVKSKEWNK